MYIYARESREWERDVEEKSITDRRLRCLNDLLLSSMDRSSFRARLQWLFFNAHVSSSPPVFFCVIAIFSYSTESRRWKTCKFDRRVLLLNSQRALHTVWLLEWIPILQYLRMSFHFVVFDRQTSNHFFAPNLPTRQRWWSHLLPPRGSEILGNTRREERATHRDFFEC